MLDMETIENTIDELEHGDTTFDSCLNLASLYIIKENFRNGRYSRTKNAENSTISELVDILPMYRKFCEIKRKYQLREQPKEMVIEAIQNVCVEIREFIMTMFYYADIEEEKEEIKSLIIGLEKEITKNLKNF